MATVRRLINQVVFETDENSLNNAENRTRRFTEGLKKAGKIVGASLLAIGGLAIKAAADMEMMTTQFEVMLGSAEKANTLMQELKKFSAATPFALPDLAKGTQTLLSFGVSQEKVVETMRMLGDTAGGNTEKLNGLILAYGKVQVKGKASMEEINMMAERGIPIIKVLQEQLGVTEQEFFKLVSSGKIGRKEITQAFQTMTSEGGMFFEGMKKQSLTFSGMLSTMKDNITLVLAEIGTKLLPTMKLLLDRITQLFQGGLGDIIADLLSVITPLVETLFNVISKVIDSLVPIIGAIVKVLKPIISIFNVIIEVVMVLVDLFLSELGEIITMLADMFTPLLEEIALLLKDLLPILMPIIKIFFQLFMLFFKINMMARILFIKVIAKGLTLMLRLLRPIIKLLSLFLIPLFTKLEQIMTGIVTFIEGIINSITEGIIRSMTFIFKIVNSVIEAINKIPWVKNKLEPLDSEEVIKMIKGEQQQINKQANIQQQNQFNFNGTGQDPSSIKSGVRQAVGTPFQVKLKELVVNSI